MKLTNVKTAITRGIGTKILATKRNSPHIFFVAGVVGTIGSTVLACRATLRLPDTLDGIQKELDEVKARQAEKPNDLHQRDMIFVYGKSALKITELYAPAIIIGTVSISALTGSHVQLARRNSALTAALVAVQNAYAEYRNRVREAVGEERELDLYRGTRVESIEDPETGKTVKKVVVDPNKMSPYAKCFDETSRYWEKDVELNRVRVMCNQKYANDLLQANGHFFLNEAYDMFDIERTEAGNVVGWRTGPDAGDNYIDFGMFDAYHQDFVNDREPRIWLDFNVDGSILDKLPKI